MNQQLLCRCCRGDYDFIHKYFCNQKECFYFSVHYDSYYQLFKSWSWDNNTEYYPSDEDITSFEHRVLAKISNMKGKGYVEEYLSGLLKIALTRTLHSSKRALVKALHLFLHSLRARNLVIRGTSLSKRHTSRSQTSVKGVLNRC